MKANGLAAVTVVLCACGGSGDTPIDGGNDANTTNDGTTNDVSTNDAAPNDAPSEASSFNPTNVLGLVLWLEADVSSSITFYPTDGGSQNIATWVDQTSHHNDAKGLPESVARNPTVKSSAIHTLPAVHFDAVGVSATTGQMLTISDNADTSLQWGTGDFFVAVVGDFDNNPANGQSDGVGVFYSKAAFSGGNTPAIGLYLYGNIPAVNVNPSVGMVFATSNTANDFVTTSNAYNNSSPHLFAIRRRGATLDLLVDGVSVATSSSNTVDVSAAKTIVRIGANDGTAASLRLDGDIGEMIAVKGTLSSTDEAGLDAYLKAKWATP